jgi:hypothetical protein
LVIAPKITYIQVLASLVLVDKEILDELSRLPSKASFLLAPNMPQIWKIIASKGLQGGI